MKALLLPCTSTTASRPPALPVPTCSRSETLSRRLRCTPGPRLACRAAADGADGPLQPGMEAYAEALQIYNQAQQMANIQTRFDLETAWSAEPSSADDPGPLPTRDQVVAFLLEEGLSAAEATALFKELYGGPHSSQPAAASRDQALPGPRIHSLDMLAAKFRRWRRVLPGVDVARMVAKDCGVLYADLSHAIRCLIQLVERMPHRDVMGMIPKQPRILWAPDLPDRFERTVAHLMVLHPSRDRDIVLDLISEYPELLYRMDYYPQATILDELPVELQNMMIVADLGLGQTYRYFRNRRTDYAAEMDQSTYESEEES